MTTETVRIQQSEAVTVEIKLNVLDCPRCGVVFAVTTDLEKRRRDDGALFYCPNGHTMTYGDSQADKLRRKLASAEQDAKWYAERAKSEEERAEREARRGAAARGVVTKMRRRAIAGACQFCHRTFANVERHIVTKHPDETTSLPTELEA